MSDHQVFGCRAYAVILNLAGSLALANMHVHAHAHVKLCNQSRVQTFNGMAAPLSDIYNILY